MKNGPRVGRDVWSLSAATFLNRATGFLGLFAAVFFTQIQMSRKAIVIALLVVGIAGVAGSLLGGQLAHKLGNRPVLFASTVTNVGLFTVLATSDFSITWWVVAVSAVSVLSSQAFVGPAAAIIAESAQGRDRVSRFAFYRIFINVGSVIAPALVGIIGREHFHVLFWLSALGSAITPFVLIAGGRSRSLFAGLGRPVPTSRKAKTSAGVRAAEPGPASRHSIALPLIYVAMALTMVVYAQHQSAVPLRLQSDPHGLQLYSLLLIINPVIVLTVEYPLSHVIKRMPGHVALAVGVVAMGTGVSITGVLASFPAMAIAGWVLFSIGECVFAPMSSSYVAQLSRDGDQSRAQGHLAASQSVGGALGPSIGSWMLLSFSVGAWIAIQAITTFAAALVCAARCLQSRAARRVYVCAAD